MKSFVKAAVVLATLQGAFATPLSKRDPSWFRPTGSSVNANGANGGNNYGGNGANGGNINVGSGYRGYGSSVNANGANGGTNRYGSGANGGSIDVNRREEEMEDFFLPIFRPVPSSNNAITASGANGGTNYYGNGANGGRISVNRRGEDAEETSDFLFWPIWRPNSYTSNGPITASGANGGTNYNGDGANGGRISVNRRGEDAEEAGDFFFRPIWRPYSYNGRVTATGANGGTNYYGDGANGGDISVN